MAEHEQFELSVAGYLLGAAEPEEAAAIRRHLDGCADCQQLAARLRRVTDAIPVAIEPVQPPERLRSRILAAAAAAPQTVESESSVLVPLRRVRRMAARNRGLLARAAGLAAAIALTAGVTYGVTAHVVGQPASVVRYTLTGSGQLRGARATVVELRQDGVTLVDFRALPAPDQGKVYELWLITAQGRPYPAGVFRPQDDGSYQLVLAKPLAAYRKMGVTIEQGPNGSSSPSQAPELAGTIS